VVSQSQPVIYSNNLVTPRSTVIVPNRQSVQIQPSVLPPPVQIQQRPNIIPQIYAPQIQQRQIIQQPQVQAFVKPIPQPIVHQTVQQNFQQIQPLAQQVVSQQVIQAPAVQQIAQIPQVVSPSSQILVNNARVNNTVTVNS
jgi:hypothetical protein